MLYFDHIAINRLTDLYLEDNIGARFGSDSVLGLSIREIVSVMAVDCLEGGLASHVKSSSSSNG